jgi:phage regulator Rha-like protein
MNNLVTNQNGRPVTNSLLVAQKFGKEHRVVIAAIKNLLHSDQKCEQFFCNNNLQG